jgi:uncharacterized protein YndB with AHSA1/START domain
MVRAAVISLTKSVVVGAPPDRVFAYVTDPMKMAEWIPAMVEIRDLIGSGEGQQFGWTYKYVGLLLTGQTTVVEYVQDECFVLQSIGTISSVWTMLVTPHEDGSTFTCELEYNIPIPVLGKLAEHLVLKRDARTIELALTNAKEIIEG